MKIRLFLPMAAMAASLPAATIGTSPLDPAFSAKQILIASPGAANGLYYLDADGAGPATTYQAYADMTTAGGGWTLALNSLNGSPASTTDIAGLTGTPGLNTGYTVDARYLAVDQNAQIRHRILSTGGTFLLDAYYTGKYYDPLPSAASWTVLAGNLSVISNQLGWGWTTATHDVDGFGGGNCTSFYGVPWYYSACWDTIPDYYSSGLHGPATNGGSLALGQYSIFVRESTTPDPPASTPEPASWLLLAPGLLLLRFSAVRSAWSK